MAEGEGHVETLRVVPAVTHQQALAVADMSELSGEVAERGVVLEPHRHGLGELARGVHRTVEHVSHSAAARLTEQPALDDRGHTVGEGERDHAAVRQHHHDTRVHREHGIEHRKLLGGQIDVVAVEALRLLRGREPEEEHGHVSRRRDVDGFRPQVVCRASGRGDGTTFDREARGVGDVVAADGAQSVEGLVDARGVDQRRARSLEPRLGRERADHGDLLVVGERQQRTVVLQQHDGPTSGLPGQRVVRVDVERAGHGRTPGGLAHEVDRATGCGVEHALGEFAGAHGCDELRIRPPTGRGHLQVESCGDAGDAVVHGSPVRDDEAVEAPVVAEHAGEQPGVLGGPDAVELVVRAHDRPRRSVLHDTLESAQVDLPQRTRIHVGARAHAVELLVVRSEVLERGADALRLDAADGRGSEHARHDRVFREVLEVAAAQR